MVKKALKFILKRALEKREALKENMILIKKAFNCVLKRALEERKVSRLRLSLVYDYVIQMLNKFLALFEKQALVIKGVAKAGAVKYVRFKARFHRLAKKKVEALLRNKLFVFFARLVQKIFWTCVGIGIYAAILIKTQPDGYERVTDVLKRLFPWMW